MTCDIFIRSYYKDFEWLSYCLAAIERYCSGFRSVVVVIPETSRTRLNKLSLPASGVRLEFCHAYRDDYLGQQATKMLADLFTDADFICHVDSDCIFSRQTTPEDLVFRGRVRVVIRPNKLLGRQRPWQQPTERFLGWPVTYDFMQQQPFTFPRWLYSQVRNHCTRLHEVDIETYITSQPPRSFSEYNVLGAYAYRYCAESFLWIDTSAEELAEPNCRWYWSWGGFTPEIRREIEQIITAPVA
jgi:hypothetical protein